MENNKNQFDVIFLTNNENSYSLYEWIQTKCSAILISDPITVGDIYTYNPRLIISYNYAHIVGEEVIGLMKSRMINMHISYLPWNRGANPNFWSFIDDTPKGVTIHLLSKGLDKGDILFQKEVFFDREKETFASTYEKLHSEMVNLLKEHWEEIFYQKAVPYSQNGKGSYHSQKDFLDIKERLHFSWDDCIGNIIEQYRKLEK